MDEQDHVQPGRGQARPHLQAMSSRALDSHHPDQPQPPAVLRPLLKQFGHPSGWLGRLAGVLMARGAEDDHWVVDLLDVQPHDRVLEVGFGPGVAVELLARRASSGLVAGVDPSEVMLRQAIKRNREAIRAGRVRLQLGSVSALPYRDASFTKACAIHSLYFWPSIEDGLRELQRVLQPQARLVLAVRMRRPGAGRLDPSRYGLGDREIAQLASQLEGSGFGEVETRQHELARETIAALMARRRPS